MYCGTCGTKLSEGARFCPNCGAPVAGAAENSIQTAAGSGNGRKTRTGLIAGICAAGLAIVMLACVFIGMAQRKNGLSENRLFSRNEDQDDARQWESGDDQRAGDRDEEADSGIVPNPDDYFGMTQINPVDDGFYSFGYWIVDEWESVLAQTEAFVGVLQEQYGMTLTNTSYDEGYGDAPVYYLSCAAADVHDLAQIDDDAYLDGCHVLVEAMALDDGVLVMVFYSDGLEIENFDPTDYVELDEPEPDEVPAPEDVPEPDDTPEPVTEPDGAVLPDLGVFLQCGRREDMSAYGGYLVSYSFDMDEGMYIVDDVLDLMLESQYELTLDKTDHKDYTEVSAQVFDDYYYSYTGNESVGQVDIFGEVSDVRVGVAYYYSEGRISVTLYFGDGFTLVDPGKKLKEPPGDMSGNPISGGSSGGSDPYIPEFSKPDCSMCGGTGDCQTCGGNGYLWSSAADKENRNCYRCRNHDGKCTYCNGTGKRS